jgi:ADP-heptose:LPS heptosyltransferase
MESDGQFHPENILILRALQLGDLLCSVPALRALRGSFPNANITLLGLPWAQSFVRRFNRYLDGFIEFPGYPGLPEQPVDYQRIPSFLSVIQRCKFDLAIQMQGSGSIVNPLIALFGAAQTAGYCLPDQYCPDEATFLDYPDHLPEVKRHLALMEFLGVPAQGEELEFPLTTADYSECELILERNGLTAGEYACIHPGARALERRWAPESFSEVADRLAGQGLKIVITGTEGEKELTTQVAGLMRYTALNLCGQTSLGEFACLLKQSRLLVCNDTGASHIADALKVPSVVLFSTPEWDRWAPFDRRLHRVIENAAEVSAGQVIYEVEELMDEACIHVA